MRRFFRIAPILALVVCLCLPVGASAVDIESDEMDVSVDASSTETGSDALADTSMETFTTETESGNVTINVIVPTASDTSSDDVSQDISEEDALELGIEDAPSYPTYSTRTLDDITPSEDTETMPGLLTALFGAYTPRTQTVTEYLSDGSSVTYTEVVPGLAGLDWPWVASVTLFTMALYCIFRMIGGLMKWN